MRIFPEKTGLRYAGHFVKIIFRQYSSRKVVDTSKQSNFHEFRIRVCEKFAKENLLKIVDYIVKLYAKC